MRWPDDSVPIAGQCLWPFEKSKLPLVSVLAAVSMFHQPSCFENISF